jgi:hypothetical protein
MTGDPMKVACTKCKKYYTLNQDVTGIIDEVGTLLKCELCGAVSMVALYPVPSKSIVRRLAVQHDKPINEVNFSPLEKGEE